MDRIPRTVVFHTKDMPNKLRKNAILLVSWKGDKRQKEPFVTPAIFDRGKWKNCSGYKIIWNDDDLIFCGWAEMPEGVA